MRVAVNAAFVEPGIVGGTEPYTVRLLEAVAAHRPDDVEVVVHGSGALFESYPRLGGHQTATLPGPLGMRPYRVAVESLVLPRRTASVDVTHHFGGRIPQRHTRPAVVTIHDIQALDLPDNFSKVKRAFLERALPRSARDAALVCTPTRWVADMVQERFGLHPERVRVVGPAHGRRPLLSQRDLLPPQLRNRRTVLFPAITHPHKNHAVLIEAMVQVHEQLPDAVLILTGGAGAAGPDVAARIEQVDPEGEFVTHLGRVSEALLGGLLADADLVAFPSRYEGFGLPLIEAMQVGTPVVAAATTCLPEVVADAGVLLDPDDVDGWTREIVDILTDSDRGAALAAAGAVRAEAFAPEIAAEGLIDAWRDAIR